MARNFRSRTLLMASDRPEEWLWMARNFRSRTLCKESILLRHHVVDGAQFPITYTPASVFISGPPGCGWRAISDHVHSSSPRRCANDQLWMARNFRSRTLSRNNWKRRLRVVDGAQFPITYTLGVDRAVRELRCGWRAISDHVHSSAQHSRKRYSLWMARNFRSRTLSRCPRRFPSAVVDGAQFPITYTLAARKRLFYQVFIRESG